MSIRILSESQRDMAAGAIVFLVALLAFAHSIPFEFLNWDDHTYIQKNAWLLNLSWKNASGVFAHSYFSNYHPLTMLSYMVDFHYFGYEPAGYRFGNILLHAGTALVSFAVMRVMSAQRVVAAAFAILFSVHPLRIESVVWISERKDVLCAFFYMLSFLLWAVPVRKRFASITLWGCLLCGILALLSKAMAISLPCIFILYEILFRKKFALSRAALCALLTAGSVAIAIANHAAQETALIAGYPLWERMKVASWAPVHYTLKTLLPFNLSPLYPFESRPTQNVIPVLLGFLFSTGLAATALACWRRGPAVTFAILGGSVVLAPVSGIVAFSAAYAADRYSYLPTLIFFVGAAVFISPLIRNARTKVRFVIASIALCLVLEAVSLTLLTHWKNSQTVWERVLAIYPESRKAQLNAFHAKTLSDKQGGIDEVAAAELRDFTQASELSASAALKKRDFAAAMKEARAIADKPVSLYWQARIARETRDVNAIKSIATEMASERQATPEQRAEIALSLATVGETSQARELMSTIDVPTVSGAFAWAQIASQTGNAVARVEYAENALDIFPAEFNALQIVIDADPPATL
ncbi:MAG: hypothetical protein ABI579_02275, partial [Candidatus Sumerlaeota bacterium]